MKRSWDEGDRSPSSLPHKQLLNKTLKDHLGASPKPANSLSLFNFKPVISYYYTPLFPFVNSQFLRHFSVRSSGL